MVEVITLLVLFLPAALLFGLAVWLGRSTYHAISPMWLIPRGEYTLARRRYEGVLNSYRRHLPGVSETSKLGVAICRGLEGDFETSLHDLRALAAMPPTNKPFEFAVDVALGFTLVLLGRDHEEARDRLVAAIALSPAPDLHFALAHAQLSLGAREEAEASFRAGLDAPLTSNTQVSARVLVRRDPASVEVSTLMLRGWYLVRVGRPDEAKPFLEAAARHSVPSPTRTRAQELLVGLGATPPIDQAPPSLAAMTISRR